MARGPGQIDVVTEVGYCPSCGRTRNLRREEHHLGQLVRTIVTCETCHRTLSTSIGPAATPEPEKPEPQPEPVAAETPAPKKATNKAAAAKPAAAKTVAAKKPAAKKPAAKKPAVKKPAGKPASTATRKNTKKK